MNVNVESLVSMTEANQNFSKVARLVDQHGSAVILRNNRPAYAIVAFDRLQEEGKELDGSDLATDAVVRATSQKLMKKHANVYQELAK